MQYCAASSSAKDTAARPRRPVRRRTLNGITPSLPVFLALLAEALHRHHALVLGGVEHDHAAGLAALDADLGDAAADQLAAVGDQHQLVLLLHRERADQA